MRHTFASATFILSLTALLPAAHAADPRQLVEMPGPMQEHMLSNMRDHLVAMGEIQAALGKGDFDRAADIAEQRIGMNSLQTHGGGCKNFCVNGHLAGNCRHFERSSNDRSKSTTRRFDRQPAVWL